MAGDKIQIHRKARFHISFENATRHNVAYVANISDLLIHGLDFLKENNFKLNFKNNELHSRLDDEAKQKSRKETCLSSNSRN